MISGTILLSFVWLCLTRSFAPSDLAIGVAASCLVVFLQRRLFAQFESVAGVVLRRPHRALLFLGTLFFRLAASTVYTSWLILTGKEEGRFVIVPLRVQNPFGQFVLLNSITLTPSTISLLIGDDGLYIHWLGSRGGGGDWRGIKDPIERRVLDLFGGGERS